VDYVVGLFASVLVMGGFDFLWLSNSSGAQSPRPPLLAEDPYATVALIFYVTHIAGVLIFAVRPVLDAGDWKGRCSVFSPRPLATSPTSPG
jgi:uncharacterized membrane protein